MKFENQDAFKLAVAYMERKENVTGITVYFKSCSDASPGGVRRSALLQP
ncbi:MAG: hypothetical protein E6556_10480 [Pantoea sp.]|nr:hypothetical protein [Pantoea sp.]